MRKAFIVISLALSLFSANANALISVCDIFYNYPTHWVYWTADDEDDYTYGYQETQVRLIPTPTWSGDQNWVLATEPYDVVFLYLHNLTTGGPPPPGSYVVSGSGSLMYINTNPFWVDTLGPDVCAKTVVVI